MRFHHLMNHVAAACRQPDPLNVSTLDCLSLTCKTTRMRFHNLVNHVAAACRQPGPFESQHSRLLEPHSQDDTHEIPPPHQPCCSNMQTACSLESQHSGLLESHLRDGTHEIPQPHQPYCSSVQTASSCESQLSGPIEPHCRTTRMRFHHLINHVAAAC